MNTLCPHMGLKQRNSINHHGRGRKGNETYIVRRRWVGDDTGTSAVSIVESSLAAVKSSLAEESKFGLRKIRPFKPLVGHVAAAD